MLKTIFETKATNMSLPIIFAGTENALPAVGTAQNVIYFVKNTKKIFITNGDGNPLLQLTDPAGLLASLINVANGIAGLDESGRIDADQLPSFVDDVIEGYLDIGDTEGNGYEAFYEEATFDTIIAGEAGKIYSDLTPGENKTYRWGGTAFVNVSNPHTHTNKENLDTIDQDLSKTDGVEFASVKSGLPPFTVGFILAQTGWYLHGLEINTSENTNWDGYNISQEFFAFVKYHKRAFYDQSLNVLQVLNLTEYNPSWDSIDFWESHLTDPVKDVWALRHSYCELEKNTYLLATPPAVGATQIIDIKRNGFTLELGDDGAVPKTGKIVGDLIRVYIEKISSTEKWYHVINLDMPNNPFGLSASDIDAAASSEFNSLSDDFANINTAPEANKNSRLTITQGTGSPYNIDCGSNMRHMYCSMTHDGILVASPDTVGAPMMIDIKRNGYAIQFGSGAETPVAGTVTNDLIRVFIEKIGATSFQYQVLNLNE